MTSRALIFMAVPLVLLHSAASHSATVGTPTDSIGEIAMSGVVRDDENRGIQAAIIRVEHLASGVARVGLSDPHGAFWVPLFDEGDYELSVSKRGYSSDAPITLRVNETVNDVSFKLHSLTEVRLHNATSADIIKHLPDTPSKMIFVDSCVACHSLGRVLSRGRSPMEWRYTMERMAKMPGGYIRVNDNFEAIFDYLTEYFGPHSELPYTLGKKIKQDLANPEIPLGHEIIYTEYDIPTPIAFAHTAVPDDRGNVWAGLFGLGKVGRLEIDKKKVTEIGPLITPNARPHGITVSPQGIVWFTGGPMIGRLDPETEEITEFEVPQPGSAHTIIVARDGRIWFTDIRYDFVRSFDPDTGEFNKYPVDTGAEQDSPYGILEHPEIDNLFWFCLKRGAACGFLNADTGELETYPASSPHAHPQRLRFDEDGRVWLGQYGEVEELGGKLAMIDPKEGKMIEYDMPYRGSAYCLSIDEDGYVWVASFERDSLIRFDPATEAMVEYPLPGVGVIIRDIWTDKEGRMWFGEWGRNKIASAKPFAR